MRNISVFILVVLFFTQIQINLLAQAPCVESPPGSGNWVEQDGSPCRNAISTVVPFLRIAPDARSTGMGNIGLATSADANSMHYNAAKYASSKDNGGIALSYVPWLRGLGLSDIYLAYLAGYYKFSKNEAIAGSIKYFSLGEFIFTDINQTEIGRGRPHEFEISAAYSRQLGDKFYAALTGKYISSNLATGQNLNGIDIETARTGAADIAVYYKTPLNTNTKSNLSLGATVSNLGGRIYYSKETNVRDLLPANLGLGAVWDIDYDEYNRLSIGLDVNKLLVPSPDPKFTDTDQDGFPDYREKALLPAIFGSFTDASGGFKEELREYQFGAGLEYWYNQQFALRAGYLYENPLKGNQRYVTLGIGLKYTTFGLNMSYIVPTSNIPNALDNTLRFTIIFDFGTFESEGTEDF